MFSRIWQGLRRYFLLHLIRLFRARGKSEEVARGFSIGLVVNFFPTFGFGIVLSPALARLFGGNVVAGLVGGALLFFFWPVLFFLNVQTGSLFVKPPLLIDELEDVTERSIHTLQWGATFMTGAILNALVTGVVAYYLLLFIHRNYQHLALKHFRSQAATTPSMDGERRKTPDEIPKVAPSAPHHETRR